MTKDTLPPWAVKIIGAVGVVIMGGAVTWMTYIHTNQVSIGQRQAEINVKLEHLQSSAAASDAHRDLRYNELSARHSELREDLRRFMERIEAKIDKLGNSSSSVVNK